MDGDVDYTTGSNWYTWNTVQLEKIRNDGGNNTDEWLNIMGAFLSTAPYVFMALGSASRIDICLDKFGWYDPKTGTYSPMCNRYVVFLIATAAIWLLTYVTIVLRQRWLDLANHKSWRIYTWLVSLALIVFTIGFLVGLQRILQGARRNMHLERVVLCVPPARESPKLQQTATLTLCAQGAPLACSSSCSTPTSTSSSRSTRW